MKKYIIIFVTLFSIVYYVNAQQFADKAFYLVDSLVLEELTEDDVYLLDSILTVYHKSDDTTKINCLQELAHSLYDEKLWVHYNAISKPLIDKVKNTSSNKEILDACTYFEALYYSNYTYLFYHQNQIDSCIKYSFKSIDLFQQINETEMVGTALSELGVLYYNVGNRHLALQKFTESSELLESVKGDADALSVNYKNIGNIYKDFGEFEKAKKYYLKAIEVVKNTPFLSRLGHVYLSLSILSQNENKFEEALSYLDSALATFTKIKLERGLSSTYSGYGKVYNSLGNYQEAEKNHLLAVQSANKQNNSRVKRFVYNNFASFLINQNRFTEAQNWLNKSAELANKGGSSIADEVKYNKLQQELYYKKGNYKKAYETYKMYDALQDSLFHDKVRNNVVRHDINNQYQKQKEIDDLKNQQALALEAEKRKKQRIFLMATIVGLIVFAGLLAFIFNRLQLIKKQKIELDSAYAQLEESKKNELAVSNLKALQSQMNPHFIFNALNSVQDLVLLKDIRNSNKFLGKFSDLIRKILLSSKEQFISLEEEIEILTLYLDLEKLRFGDEFVINFSCDITQEKQEEIQLPAMFIQPYIENAIKHGLFHKEGEKTLKVAFSLLDKNTLECIIEDNGVGQKQAAIFKEKRLHLHTGFSTEAINERIRLLNQTLDKKIALQIIDLEENGIAKGTKIVLHFPV